MIEGAVSDKDAMVRIMRRLDRGWVLTKITFCKPGCPAAIHLHFRKDES